MIPKLPTAATRKLLVKTFAALLATVSLEAASQVTTPAQTTAAPPKSTDSASGQSHPDDLDLNSQTLAPVDITASRISDVLPSTSHLDEQDLAAQRGIISDSARLLQDIPGVSLYGAGGISSLPVIHGMADDRLRVQVDGMDLMSACPNHMNSVLSYINPTTVGSVTVYAGITPVSLGGDSIGGTIQVKSAPPIFASAEEGVLVKGQAGGLSRSNGNASGYNFGATLAGQNVSLSYSESSAKSDNYTSARDFKDAGLAAPDRGWLAGNVVGSSAYTASTTQNIGLALRYEDQLLQLNLSEQKVGFEGFPNQRMDMTDNNNTMVNLRYTGQFQWGELEARVYEQNTQHKMDFGPDRFFYGYGMPMNSQSKTRGALIKGSIELSERDMLRLGSEYQTYDLDDWWPKVGKSGSMCCNSFWNILDGERDRVAIFGEWEARWNAEWLSLLGVRTDIVKTDAGPVQGYNTKPMWARDAKAFNSLDHQRTFHNLDLTALVRYIPDATQTYEAGFARKSRAPSLYELYPWSKDSMAALMNNFVGDGNGYIGNIDLKPEVAHTFSGTGDWHDADKQIWGLKATGYLTQVENYIDAKRCYVPGSFVSCTAYNLTTKDDFVFLQYVNQSARLYGIDLSGYRILGRSDDFGSFTATGLINYVRGENRTTGDNLYHIMPLNVKLALVNRLSSWTTTAEVQMVAAKTDVSQVRNEVPTVGYSLFNLRSSYEFKYARLDLGIENVFNKFYSLPLGGAYLGQGESMTISGIPWGVTVPGMGRSFNVALNVKF